MAPENLDLSLTRVVRRSEHGDIDRWRRACGCIKTSEKLKRILSTFPAPAPPSSTPVEKFAPNTPPSCSQLESTCISSLCHHMHSYPLPVVLADYKMNAMKVPAKPVVDAFKPEEPQRTPNLENEIKQGMKALACSLIHFKNLVLVVSRRDSKLWRFIAELVTLVQLSVTATALALYYLIYCYMQLVYCTLHTALYFHNADGPMKITIAVVTLTSLVIGFNLIIRLERLIGIIPQAPS